MALKNVFINSITGFLNKLDEDIAEIYEEQYKSKVAVNTLISLLVKKGIFTQEEVKKEKAVGRKD